MTPEATRAEQSGSSFFTAVVIVVAWGVPGLGHLLLKRWGRALGFFLAVGVLAALALVLRGHVFGPGTGDPFETLGFLADLGTGAFYWVARAVDNGGPDISHAAGDYGTRFFATAGVLNLLCVLDAYEIARGKKD